jgi:hypothetical protein
MPRVRPLLHLILVVTGPLPINPIRKSLVLLAPAWQDAMAILSFKLHQHFTLLAQLLVVVAGAINTPNEPEFT